LISLFVATSIATSGTAWAQETPSVVDTPIPVSAVQPPVVPTIVPARPGYVVPWPGLLLNPAAVAQIKVELDSAKKQCDIIVEREVAVQKAHNDHELAVQKAAHERAQAEANASIKTKTSEINDLTKRLEKAEKDKPNTYLWTGLGFGAGVVVTVLTVFAVSQATK
jgi:hypothetical protein